MASERAKSIIQIAVAVIFAGLLTGTILIDNKNIFKTDSITAEQKAQALDQYGFYLDQVNDKVGIDFKHQSPELDPKLRHIARQIASMGASVSVCDYDNDGWNDLYFTNSRTGSQNALYHNERNGEFKETGVEAGVADVNKQGTGVSMGAVWGDYDNDGFEDLFLYKWGRPELFKNNGGKNFVAVTATSGLPEWVNANTAIWFDFNNDGLLDLFLGGYYKEKYDLRHLQTTEIMPESFEYANNGGKNYLLRNMGNGKFKDVASAYGLTSTKWTLAAGAADFNGDHYPELVIANDYSVDEFYFNEGGKKFVEKGKQAGIGFAPKSGMNVTFGDIDNSDELGIYVTNITEKGILLQGNNYWKPKHLPDQDVSFINLAQLAGIESGGWSYGAQFGDLNNDGFLDLYVANGFISGQKGTSYWYDYSKIMGGHKAIIGDAKNWPDMEGKSQAGYQQNKIWVNDSHGLFTEVSDKVCGKLTLDSRSVALVDLWNRGVLDVVVANQNQEPLVYSNEGRGSNHWIDFDLSGTESNHSAVGARVVLEWGGKKQTQVVTAGIGFCSQNQHRIHFGTGESIGVEKATIFWPSGRVQVVENPTINKVHHITEGKTNT